MKKSTLLVMSLITIVHGTASAYDWQSLVQDSAKINSLVSTYGTKARNFLGISFNGIGAKNAKDTATVLQATSSFAAGFGGLYGTLQAGRLFRSLKKLGYSRPVLGAAVCVGMLRAGFMGLMGASVPLGVARVVEKTA